MRDDATSAAEAINTYTDLPPLASGLKFVSLFQSFRFVPFRRVALVQSLVFALTKVGPLDSGEGNSK